MSKSETVVGNITFGKSWDSIARRYVEHDTLPQETFGPYATIDKDVTVRDMPCTSANDNAGLRGAAHIGSKSVASTVNVSIPPTAPRVDRKAAHITTYTGRFYPFSPQAEDVNIEDIAHSLSMQCRYAGHGRQFYSVAEHSVHIARWLMGCGPRAAITGLLHDATEAYVVDVPRPVKAHLAGYKDIEQKVWLAIAAKFDLDRELPAVVHIADGRICADEMSQNLHEVDQNVRPPLGITLEFWPPGVAEIYFLDMFKKLSAAIEDENMRAAA